MENDTYFGLLAEFGGSGVVELEKACEKYFGLMPSEAKRRAAHAPHLLPIPVFRAGSQKSPWLLTLADLARHLDARRAAAQAAQEKALATARAAGKEHQAPFPFG